MEKDLENAWIMKMNEISYNAQAEYTYGYNIQNYILCYPVMFVEYISKQKIFLIIKSASISFDLENKSESSFWEIRTLFLFT